MTMKIGILECGPVPEALRGTYISYPAMFAAPLSSLLLLSAIFMAMTFAVFAVYGLFAAAMRDHVLTRPRVMLWLRRTFAAAFVGLGVKLAMAER
ncbi:hypothetical protein [Ferrovibrio sp.]|uniref:hypothetical protein n=1 Tax=Ferrovibrio sp. TaxID=1917215 RepID=UPI003D29B03E